jgi:hypothetical protein
MRLSGSKKGALNVAELLPYPDPMKQQASKLKEEM